MWQRGTLHELFDAMDAGEKLRFMPSVERILGMASTFYLGKYILGYDKAGEIHRELCQWYDDNFKYCLLIMIPRQHFKTSFINIAANVRFGLNDPDIELNVEMNVEKMARNVLQELKSHYIANEKFRELYPAHATQSKKDEGTAFEFTTPARKKKYLRLPTFSANSVDKSIVSSHFTLWKFDDIVDDKNSATAEWRDKVYTAYTRCQAMMKQMSATGIPWQHVIGTPWHHDDTYARLQRVTGFKDHWRVFHRRVEWNEEDEETGEKKHIFLFPEEWNETRLDSIRNSMNPYDFSCQYYCTPTVEGQRAMESSKIRRFRTEQIDKIPMNMCITVDPASSVNRAKGDPTVIAAYGMDAKSNVYTLGVSRKWLAVDEIVDEIVHFHKLYNIRDIGVERVALSKWLIQLFDKRIKADLLNVNLIEITRDPRISKKNEGGRQERVAGFLNKGQILVSADEPEEEIIFREFDEWPHGRYDDYMDTLTDAIEILKPPVILKNTGQQYRMPPRTLAGRGNVQTGYSYRSEGYDR